MLRKRFFLNSIVLLVLLFGAACGAEPAPEDIDTPVAVAPEETAEPEAAAPTDTAEPEAVAPTEAPQATVVESSGEGEYVQNAEGVTPGQNGTVVADTGFRPAPNGFGFPNYGPDYPQGDLTINQVRRMFGDQVCESIQGDTCVPVPAAQAWLDQMNQSMAGGHCEGMAVLSAVFFTGLENPQNYGGATAFDFDPSNENLLESISYYWTLQMVDPVATEAFNFRQMTLADILDVLIQTMNEGSDFFSLGIYAPVGGHAVIPYAVEDLGNGVYWIHVYDNNYPGAGKYIEVDLNADTWRYAGAALNPAEDAAPWEGPSGTMDMASLSTRQQSLLCPFCGGAAGGGQQPGLSVLVNGKGFRLTASDRQGNQISVKDGQVVSQIPGANLVRPKGGSLYDDDQGWFLVLPKGSYKISVDGKTNQGAEPIQTAIFRPGLIYVLDGVDLDPGQHDELNVDEDGQFSYTPGDDETFNIGLGTDSPGEPDEWFELDNLAMGQGYDFNTSYDEETGKLAVSDDDPDLDNFDLEATTYDEDGSHEYTYDDVTPGDDGQAFFGVGDDGSMDMGIDADGDGDVEGLLGDQDGDGIPDDQDTDDDGDGIPDDQDTDDDGDGIPDDQEGGGEEGGGEEGGGEEGGGEEGGGEEGGD